MSDRKWTIMIYMAGDNNLDAEGIIDLQEIKRIGSTDEVAILAQFDRAQANMRTHRYFLQDRTKPNHSRISDDIVFTLPNEANTGSPAELTNFIRWGIDQFEAEHYIVIIWGHGAGAADEDIWYSDNRTLRRTIKRHGVFRPNLRDLAAHPQFVDVVTKDPRNVVAVRPALGDLFTDPSVVELVGNMDIPGVMTAIAPDDTSEDFLDNVELKTALINVGTRIDILGMDACLMSMAEVCYQVRDSVDFMVASEAEEDVDGWPYGAFLERLVDNPDMSPRQLARTIIDEFDGMYGEVEATAATLAACDLRHPKPDELAVRVDRLAAELIDKHDLIQDQILLARSIAWENEIADSADLVDFCRLLRRKVTNADVKSACTELIKFVKQEEFVFRKASIGRDVRFTEGLGIYFPMSKVSIPYGRLDMVQSGVTQWRDFITRFVQDVAAEDHT